MVLFSYGGDPIWYQDETMDTRDTRLPLELRDDREVMGRINELDKEYIALFINNSYEFEYVGFKDEESWKKFINKVNAFITLLKSCLEPEYEVHLEQWTRSQLSKTWLND